MRGGNASDDDADADGTDDDVLVFDIDDEVVVEVDRVDSDGDGILFIEVVVVDDDAVVVGVVAADNDDDDGKVCGSSTRGPLYWSS